MADPYQALYRRYRSKRFSEQRGQDHVMRALRTAVQEDRVGHAYLFSGPRGTGKTSTARILAKVLNCDAPVDGEPCCACENCLAVDEGRIVDWLLELDAASNNGVDKIRDLIERLALGISGNRKVVILDEVHMLSTAASNALLKSLEEPPSHVVFILATTDPQKVLPTIRSRTQHFEFHLLPADELADHVRHVIADAGLDLGEDAVQQVVRQGGGSARDTLSALDQVSAMGGVVPEARPVEAILDAIRTRDAGAALVAVAEAVDAGRDPRTLGEVLIEHLREAFLAVMGAPDRHLPSDDLEKAATLGGELGPAGLTRALEVLGEALVELAKKPDPRIVLEVALVRLCRPDADRSLEAVLERLERLERAVASGSTAGAPAAQPPDGTAVAPAPAGPASRAREELARVTASQPRPTRAPARKATAAPATPPPRATDERSESALRGAAPSAESVPLPSVEEMQAALEGALSGLKGGWRSMYFNASVSIDDGVVSLGVDNAHSRDHCEKQRPQVEAALAAQLGRAVPLRLVVSERSAAAAAPSVSATDDDTETEIVDVHALDDAPAAGSGVDRLTEAFPGAELVEEQ